MCAWGGGGVRNTKTKKVSKTVKRGKIQKKNHLHNVSHAVVVVLLFYVHGKYLRSCRDGQ